MSDLTHPDGASDLSGQRVTETGWRLTGRAASLIETLAPSDSLQPGRDEDVLFAARFLLRPRLLSRSPIVSAMEAISTAIHAKNPDAPHLTLDRESFIKPDRFTGLHWRPLGASPTWKGELVWRHPHPVISGVPCTTHVTLTQQHNQVSMSVRVSADRGIASVRGMVGIGQARPAFLTEMSRSVRLTFGGMEAEQRTLTDADIDGFVSGVLLSEDREYPVALLAPTEEGEYVIPPSVVSDELLGLAHLYVIDQHPATFRLSDALGDRRLSCYWGALRVYLPEFSCADDPDEHPLLVRDRLVDPVIRAGVVGRVSQHLWGFGRVFAASPARAVSRPAAVGGGGSESGSARADGLPMTGRIGTVTHGTGGGTGDLGATAAGGAGAAGSENGAGGASGAGTANGSRPEGADRPRAEDGAGGSSGARLPDELLQALTGLVSLPGSLGNLEHRLGGLVDVVQDLRRANDGLREELGRLTTASALRAANTVALERRIRSLERLLVSAASEADPQALDDWVAAENAPAAQDDDDDAVSLIDVLRQAAVAHPEELLVLDAAERSAADSPFGDAERVGIILNAMASVARRRQEGALGTSLKAAFSEMGIDYRGGISSTTSARLLQQYNVMGPGGVAYDCPEHIVLGTSYDPRFCLRIYFTSRAPLEPRFVIGHVGRHFEVASTT